MAPNKPKLYKNAAKHSKSSSEQVPNIGIISPEAEQKFEAELCWCIQKLQIGLKSGKLNNKQVQDHSKALNTLMSNTAPMVKKRQVMRLSFGDYREKMAAEEKKMLKSDLMKPAVKQVKSTIPSKSVFVKKRALTSIMRNTIQSNFGDEKNGSSNELISTSSATCPDGETFRFNFGMNDSEN